MVLVCVITATKYRKPLLKEVPTEQNLKFCSRRFQTPIGPAGDGLEVRCSLSGSGSAI